MKINFLGRFAKNTQRPNFMKMRPVGAELLHACRQTDITNRRFRNFANAPNNQSINPYLFQIVILAPVHLLFAVQNGALDETPHLANLIKLLSKTFMTQYKLISKNFAFVLENIAQ
jgi:hypothetical protein